ncbi:hypothetical protein AX15_004174 [Amanita polypyramis BW_CC]|nr:hypothetical protein AX15_004174 [Amanita polypyramis BW_CC]
MTARLRILAGPSPDELVPITHLVNASLSYKLKTDLFDGEISVHIKDFMDDQGQVRHSGYFDREDRRGVTWSIQVSGRFLVSHNVDDIMFGNIFDRRLRLPRGSSAAFKFMKFIDPTLEHDLPSQTKPWALSPLVATMPYFTRRQCATAESPTQDKTGPVMLRELSVNNMDDFGAKKGRKRKMSPGSKNLQFENTSQRRRYFRDAERRKEVELGPNDLISTDFCYGFLEFYPKLALRLPGGLSFDLMRYWDKHPVKFVCCERKKGKTDDGEDPWGRMFWCVMIEVAELEAS